MDLDNPPACTRGLKYMFQDNRLVFGGPILN
ncbi:unnamed protein product, partial [Vitis vinifera]|uniref:Uncharacterized protein n=1 Tax=Vitis vinifera TaxID=29760 RepID=D7T097_VITVI